MDVVALTGKLLSFNTINPPGNEAALAEFVAEILGDNGFNASFHNFAEGRLHLIAEKGLSAEKAPLILSGHFDTVPLGGSKWSCDPFAGEIKDGKIWGRGSSDMKGGLAAMMIASIECFRKETPAGGIRIIFSAAEELGCQGISQLYDNGEIPGIASAVIVGEPTGNVPATGHKGAIYMNAVATGVTAHSSMPSSGVNAIYKAAEAIIRIRDFSFAADIDPLLGYPTINVGKFTGGMNINSVPDHAEFTIDVRTTAKVNNDEIFERLRKVAGDEIDIRKFVDLTSVFTNEDDPFVHVVREACGIGKTSQLYALPYLTDGAVLQKRYGSPVVIFGPGEPDQAHRTDEFCYLSKLEESVNIYKNIILNWSRRDG